MYWVGWIIVGSLTLGAVFALLLGSRYSDKLGEPSSPSVC